MPRPTFFNLPDAKRQRVIDAAVDEFARLPFRAASLDRIAAASGVSKGSLYQYFDDKAELYRWLLGAYLPERKQAVFDALPRPAGTDLFALLEASFHAGLALFVREPRLAQLGAALLAPVPEPEIRDLHATLRDRSHAGLVAMVTAGQAAGEVRADLDADAAAALIASVMGHGLLDALARRAGVDVLALAGDTALVEAVPGGEIEALVRTFSAMLRGAIGAG